METDSLLWEKFEPGVIPSNTEINPNIWTMVPSMSNVLEVGCGDGRIIDWLLSRGFSVTGIDINCDAIHKLRERFVGKNVSLLCESILSPSLTPNSFDLTFMQGVVSTIALRDRVKVFQNVHKLLKPKGLLHVAEFKLDESTEEKIKRYRNDALLVGEYGTLMVRDQSDSILFTSHNFAPDELGVLFENSGFKLIDRREVTFTSYHGNQKPGLIYIGEKN